MTVRPQQLVEHALEASTSDACVVLVEDSTSANLRWANNTLTTNGVMRSTEVTVIAFAGAGNASVSGSAATPEQVTALVEAADRAAALAEAAEDRADLVAGDAVADWDDAPAETSIEVFDRFAGELGEEFTRAEAESRILYGFVFHEVTTTYLGSSTGLRRRHVQPTGHYGCTGKDTGLTTSAWVGGATRDFADVSATRMASDLATRIGWGARRLDLPAGRYDTVLPPTAVADLMVDAYWSLGARTAADGQSVFSRPGGGTRIGEPVVAPGVQLFSDPAYPALEAAPFVLAAGSSDRSSVYDNGLPLGRTSWIEDGRLAALQQTRHTARLTGQPTTTAIDNVVLSVDGGRGTDLDLAAGLDDGLLLTCLWYIREVDPQTMLLTGLTRDGVYKVEGGEIVGAVNNFRYNESPVDLLKRFSHAGETVPSFSREWGEDFFSRTATPALRVPDFNMSSVSQAL
ncbi:Predicted Zn-dependent protease or its inactivated homolog [Nocardioides scoriae]|uniref:Predicted Zn-dependent protease or its inactivated homolog n=1 Tax=Nocardioides scoriae TaxID=642780 RepID=A0A1H1NTG0_9ACTN|nr:metallopeptidase TldD-related protein [Nocardioides scoriae]SDS02271.1 Predicted Zn-dependent protease or its inactivated homolog [Nocardioides scoriae]